MSEQENIIDENDEIIDDIPKIEEPIKKNKKPMTAEKLEQLKQARLKGAEKKREMKELKNKAKQLPIEEVKLSAMKYDQLQKQKEELIKPKEEIKEEIVIPKEEKPKKIDKKKRVIKKIIYEDGSEDEVEDIRHIQPQPKNKYMTMFSNEDSYTNLVYQSACDKLKEKLQDERTKYLISSLMPNYG
jgi:DNA repair exonuclease SbcCD ATPase subunit